MIEIKNSFAQLDCLRLIIRRFEPSDLRRVYEIECRSFKDPYHILFLLNLYELYPSTFFVAEADGVVAGYIISRIIAQDLRSYSRIPQGGREAVRSCSRNGHILAIAVDPAYRRRGTGRALTEVTLKEFEKLNLEDVWLEVRLSNANAIRLYKSLGFKENGIINHYYADGEGAVILKKEF